MIFSHILAFSVALLFLPGVRAAEPEAIAERLINTPRPLVIGHRGYSKIAPENTLPAFKLAQIAGVDLTELDYHPAKDGVLMVLHDPELDRTTDAVEKWGGKRIPLESKTALELRTLDAGKWFSSIYAGTRLPTLDEAVQTIQAGGVTLIHHKVGDAALCVNFLRERRLVNHVIVQSYEWDYLRDFHKLEPRQVLGALGPIGSRAGKAVTEAQKVLDRQWVDEVEQTGARVVVWNQQITHAGVDYAHHRGLKVWVYTIDDPAQAEQLLAHGIDGIISNNPPIIWRAMALRAKSSELSH